MKREVLFYPVCQQAALAHLQGLPARLQAVAERPHPAALRTSLTASPSHQAQLALRWLQLFTRLNGGV